MRISEKYSYSKYRNKDSRPTGSGKVFVADKIKYDFNPIINLPIKFWGNLLILLILLSLGWLLFCSRYFSVNEVIVEGNNLVSKEDIAGAAGQGDNIFRYNVDQTKNKIISQFPIVEDVEIYRGIPNALKIVVLERKPVLIWQAAENYYLMDELGFIDKQITAVDYTEFLHVSDHKNMKVIVGGRVVSPEFVSFIKEVSGKFFDKTNSKVTGYYVEETTLDLYVLTDSGFYVKFDTTRNVDKQLEDLKNIIVAFRPNIHEYIDVRINGWVYYK
ncbi:MAG: FtsQ-type POTRA domain-containing protein [Patescibacteria group bacterium]|jgi:hypothetical protein